MTALVGHDKEWRQLTGALQSGKLHHGLILAGPRGIGKASFAREIAAQIVDPTNEYQALTDRGSHPDIVYIERLFKDDLKEGEERDPNDERKRSIAVKQIRGLQATLGKMTAISKHRVVIIDAADDFEVSASNALLKSLEEPPQGCHFLLVSHASDQLLPTIRSRCQIVHFNRLADSQLAELLAKLLPQTNDRERAALLQAGAGSPGQALEFAGLDIGEIDGHISKIITTGDHDNRIRFTLASKLSLKAGHKRYEAFLRRVPSIIANHARTLSAPDALAAVDAWKKASELASRAVGLSLDKKAVILEMGSLLASLNTHKQAA